MITVSEVHMPNGLVNYNLSDSYDTKKDLRSYYHTLKLNFINALDWFDFQQCKRDCENDTERDDEGNRVHDLDYYVSRAPRKVEQGLFLHLSDERDGYLERVSIVRLKIDGKGYELPLYFEPRGYYYASDLYFKINAKILKELAVATSISLSYEAKEYGFNNLDISGFQKYAFVYYDDYYVENLVSPEEKMKIRQELQPLRRRRDEEDAREKAKIAAEKRFEENEKNREAAKEAREAVRMVEWQNAGPLLKVWMWVTRHWILTLFILFILWIITLLIRFIHWLFF